jgi:hypothetical protein
MSSRNRKVAPSNEPQDPRARLFALEQELRATDLLALNATVKSAQEGVTGEELFGLLQEIRRQTLNSLERVLQIQDHPAKAS